MMADTTSAHVNSVNDKAIMMPRSWLFVPASRPDRFEKALTSGADAVIIDLEDAVSEHEKQQARQDIVKVIPELFDNQNFDSDTNHNDTGQHKALASLWVRISGKSNVDSTLHQEDLAVCQTLKSLGILKGIVIPKVETASDISEVYADIDLPVIIQIESAKGIHNLPEIAQTKGLQAISYGRLDIGNELNLTAGSQAERDFIHYVRVQLILHSKLNNLNAPIESIYADFKDKEGNQHTASYAADMGFSGMLCIHPTQVTLVNEAFKASVTQLAFAKKVIAHYQSTGDSVFAIDGQMVDLPVILQCQRLLEVD